MLSENAIDKLIQPLIDRQNQIETALILKIAERIREIGEMLPSDVYKLERLYKSGADIREINKMLASLTGLQESEIKRIIKTVAEDAYKDAKPYYDYREKPFIPFEENEPLQKAVKAIEQVTLADYTNLSNATAFMQRDAVNPLIVRPTPIAEAYQRVIDLGIQSVTMGAESYNTAIKKAMEQLVNSGLKTVEYTTDRGIKHYTRLDTAVRRNILDGIRNVSQAVHDLNGEKFGANGKEIDVHMFSAPDHEPVQGHQFTNEEYDKLQTGKPFEDVNGVHFEAIKRPIGMWNCRHLAHSIVMETSIPVYTQEELDEIIEKNHKGCEYTDIHGNKHHLTMYECTQRQRAYELKIRKAKEGKKMAETAGDEELKKKYQAEIIKNQNEYKAFCKGCGLRTRFENTRIYTAKDTVKSTAVKGVDKSAESGIIKSQGGKIMSINNIDSPIEARNTGKGNPNAILHTGRPLNNRQKNLLDALTDYDSKVTVAKKNVNMHDLSALTAITGDEFALFTKGKERLVIRGNANSVNIDIEKAVELSKQGYKWSGHTHPGIMGNTLIASDGDKLILKAFNQEKSVIYNSKGSYEVFYEEW